MKKIFRYLLYTFFLVIALEVKVEAADISTIHAVLYTNASTTIYLGADLSGTIVLPVVEEGLPVKVTGVTDNGFFQVDIAGTYYIPCSGLVGTARGAKKSSSYDEMTDLSDLVIAAKYKYTEFIKEVVELVNEEREKVGLNPLEYHDELTYAATRRSVENAYYNNFSHTRPNGTSCLTIFAEYDMQNYHRAGENIALRQKTPKEVVEDWMESPSHRDNVLGRYTKIGVGVASDEKGQLYWTQLFYA